MANEKFQISLNLPAAQAKVDAIMDEIGKALGQGSVSSRSYNPSTGALEIFCAGEGAKKAVNLISAKLQTAAGKKVTVSALSSSSKLVESKQEKSK